MKQQLNSWNIKSVNLTDGIKKVVQRRKRKLVGKRKQHKWLLLCDHNFFTQGQQESHVIVTYYSWLWGIYKRQFRPITQKCSTHYLEYNCCKRRIHKWAVTIPLSHPIYMTWYLPTPCCTCTSSLITLAPHTQPAQLLKLVYRSLCITSSLESTSWLISSSISSPHSSRFVSHS